MPAPSPNTPNAQPNGFWKREAPTLRDIAPTMTMAQLVQRYNTTRRRMLQTLNRFNIEFADKHKGTLNKQQVQELAQLAPTHTAHQLREHFGVPLARIYGYLSRHKIKAKPCNSGPLWFGRRAELLRIAPGMTIEDLQAHYAAQGHQHTIGAIRQALASMGIKWKRSRVQPELLGRKPELAQLATRMTCKQMAARLGYSRNYMWKMLKQMGITALPGMSGPASKRATPGKTSTPAKPTPKAAKPVPAPRLTQPAKLMSAAIPSNASIASRKPAQIIWPEHVKVQHIRLPKPPANAPICSGTMRAPYVPSQDWYRSPRAI